MPGLPYQARQEKLRSHPMDHEDRFYLAMIHGQLGKEAEMRKTYDQAIMEISKQKSPGEGASMLRKEPEQLPGTTPAPPP